MYYKYSGISNRGTAASAAGSRGAGMTVTELNRMLSGVLRAAPATRDVTVTAEVSGFKNHIASGHWYFSLKDRESAISCVMFRQNTLRGAAVRPGDGDSVTVTGHVEMYERDGKIQLYVSTLRPAGSGSLYEQFEALKRKLAAEGLFDPARKRILPMMPRRVAVITSGSGAALHDILNVSGMRSPAVPLVVVPSAVQGAGAPEELRRALRMAQKLNGVDVIILARGGGSPEDLWCFNDEALARDVAACTIPVVSGVGHEIDFTLCDYAADVRASTPSNAAEIVFPDRKELKSRTDLLRAGLNRSLDAAVNRMQMESFGMRRRLQNCSPERRVHLLEDGTHRIREQLEKVIQLRMETESGLIGRRRLELNHGLTRCLDEKTARLSSLRAGLRALNPLGVLERGYALVYQEPEGKLLTRAQEARGKAELRIRFADGSVSVTGKENNSA